MGQTTVKEIVVLLRLAACSVTVARWHWHRRGHGNGSATVAGFSVVVGVRRGVAAVAVGGDPAVDRRAGGVGMLGPGPNGTRRRRRDRRSGDVAARAPRVPAVARSAVRGVPRGVPSRLTYVST